MLLDVCPGKAAIVSDSDDSDSDADSDDTCLSDDAAVLVPTAFLDSDDDNDFEGF